MQVLEAVDAKKLPEKSKASSSSPICSRSADQNFHPLDPGLLSLQAAVSQFLQPSLHKKQSCASALFNPLTSMSFSTMSFHLTLLCLLLNPKLQNLLLLIEIFQHTSFLPKLSQSQLS